MASRFDEDEEGGVLPVVEALLVTLLVVGAILFVGYLRRGSDIESLSPPTAAESRAAKDALEMLHDVTLVVSMTPMQSMDFDTWTDEIFMDGPQRGEVLVALEEAIQSLLPPAHAYELRINYGVGSIPVLSRGSPASAAGGSAFFQPAIPVVTQSPPGCSIRVPGPLPDIPTGEQISHEVVPGEVATGRPTGELPPPTTCKYYGGRVLFDNMLGVDGVAGTPDDRAVCDPYERSRAPSGATWTSIWAAGRMNYTVPTGVPFGTWFLSFQPLSNPNACTIAAPCDAPAFGSPQRPCLDVVLPGYVAPAQRPIYELQLVVGPLV